MILEDLEVMGPVKVADVESAQQRILDVVSNLKDEGKVVLQGKGGDEAFV